MLSVSLSAPIPQRLRGAPNYPSSFKVAHPSLFRRSISFDLPKLLITEPGYVCSVDACYAESVANERCANYSMLLSNKPFSWTEFTLIMPRERSSASFCRLQSLNASSGELGLVLSKIYDSVLLMVGLSTRDNCIIFNIT